MSGVAAGWLIERLPQLKQLHVYLPIDHAAAAAAAAAGSDAAPASKSLPVQLIGDRLLYAPPPPQPLARIDLKPLLTSAGAAAAAATAAVTAAAPSTATSPASAASIVASSDHYLVRVPLPSNFVVTDESDDFPTAAELDIKRVRYLCCRECGLPLTAPLTPQPQVADSKSAASALSVDLCPTRILPLPSPYWQELVDLWYCHNAESSALRPTELAGIHPPPVSPLVTVVITTPDAPPLPPLEPEAGADTKSNAAAPPPAPAAASASAPAGGKMDIEESNPKLQAAAGDAKLPPPAAAVPNRKPKTATGAGYGPPPGTVRTVTRGGVVYYMGVSHVLLHASALEKTAIVYEPFAVPASARERARWGMTNGDANARTTHSHSHAHAHVHGAGAAKLAHDFKSGAVTGKANVAAAAAAKQTETKAKDATKPATAEDEPAALMRVLCARCSSVIGEADITLPPPPAISPYASVLLGGLAAAKAAASVMPTPVDPAASDVRLFKYKLSTCTRHVHSRSAAAAAAAAAVAAFDTLSFDSASPKAVNTQSTAAGSSVVASNDHSDPSPCVCAVNRNAFAFYTPENAVASEILAYSQAHACFRFVISDEEQNDAVNTSGKRTAVTSGGESETDVDDDASERRHYLQIVLLNWETAVKTDTVPAGSGSGLAMAPVIKVIYRFTENTRETQRWARQSNNRTHLLSYSSSLFAAFRHALHTHSLYFPPSVRAFQPPSQHAASPAPARAVAAAAASTAPAHAFAPLTGAAAAARHNPNATRPAVAAEAPFTLSFLRRLSKAV